VRYESLAGRIRARRSGPEADPRSGGDRDDEQHQHDQFDPSACAV